MKKVNIEEAKAILEKHDIVAIPTETVYGLAAMINSNTALTKIFKTKERPFFDPLIIHVSSTEMAKSLTPKWNEVCDVLAQNFWPGPLTLILEKESHIDPLITAGLSHVGIRMPKHPLALELIEKLQVPLAAPSANKFKKTSPTQASHVFEEFGEQVSLLDGGSSEVGIESTVAQIFDEKIIIYRPGQITKEMMSEKLISAGLKMKISYGTSPVAPGQLEEHYRPSVPLILLDANSIYDEMKKELLKNNINLTRLLNFKLPSSPELAARLIYQKMRELSQEGATAIAFYLPTDIQHNENWMGVINRLTKACSYNFSSI